MSTPALIAGIIGVALCIVMIALVAIFKPRRHIPGMPPMGIPVIIAIVLLVAAGLAIVLLFTGGRR